MYLRVLQLRRTASKFAGGRRIIQSAFEGEGEGGTGGGKDGSGGEGGTGDEGEGGTGGGEPSGGASKTFTQEQVNKLLADDRRKHQSKIDKLTDQLNNSSSLTSKERLELESRIEELNNNMLTKEQLAAKEREKNAKRHQTELEAVVGERDTWKNRYTDSTINNAIIQAAETNEAHRSQQLVAILKPNTRLAEELDSEGKPTGNFVPKVKFEDVDKDGNPITLDLTIDEAIKNMKEKPEIHGNLFKSGVVPGLGQGGNNGNSASSDEPPINNPEEYRKWRKEQKKKGKL